MQPVSQMNQTGDRQVKRLDNHRVFRPEAVEAYATRRAGEVWVSRIRGELWSIAGLTIVAAAAVVFLFLGGR
jgi:hypothetical protein